MATRTVHDGKIVTPRTYRIVYLWSEQGVEELLAGGTWGLWFLGLLGLDTFLLEEFLSTNSLGVGVETEEDALIDQWVLVLSPRALGDFGVGRSDDSLDHGAVDDASDIGVCDLGGRENVVLLVDGSLIEGTKDLIEKAEGILSPDNKSTKVTTRGELEQVQSANIDHLNAREVPECLDDTIVLVVHNERATTLAVPTTPDLSFSGSRFPRVGDLCNIIVGVDCFEESDGILSLDQRLDIGGNDKRNFLCSLNSVTAGENEGRKSRSGQGRDDGESALSLVNLDMPLAPSFRRGEHTATTAHVTESSLTRAVGSSTTNTGDTSYGTASTPRLGGGLVTGFFADSIWLSLIFCDTLVNLLDDIESDRSSQNCW